MLRTLAHFRFKQYNSSQDLLSQTPDTMCAGSSNVMVSGSGRNFTFKGISQISGPLAGGQVMMNVAEDYAGLGAYNETGIGSVFRVLGAWFFIGAGSLFKNGVDTTADASTTLQIKKVTAGALGTTYQAGLAQPSAPTIQAVAAPSTYTGKNNGVVSVRIARVRAATGARSNASLTSNVVTATNQSIAITFPSADANGQDYWEVDVTKNGEGAVGNHYFLQEIPESVIAGVVTASTVTDADTTIGVANGTLTALHIGWQYTSSGDTTTYVTAVGANDSHSAGKQTITLNAASVLTTTQSATFTRAVTGSTRTYVFEWRDADLIGSDLAPTRDYPPPAAIFGGASGDVVFVDGALGDTVDVTQYAKDNSIASANTTTSTVGNAIAVSDPSRPESFPPSNYVFTGDAPTCILPGGQGMHWRFSQNSMGVIRYVGGSPAVSYERLWTGIGITNQRQAVLGSGGRLYAFTGQRGLVRLGSNGEPDTAFAAPVHEDLDAFTASNVCLGYDANQQYVLVMHGRTVLAFYEPLEIWCAPLSVSTALTNKNVISAVTVAGNCYLSVGRQSLDPLTLYNFNAGSGSTTSIVVSPWIESEDVSTLISRVQVNLRADSSAVSNANCEVRINGSSTASTSQSLSVSGSSLGGLFHTPVLRPNVRSAKSFRIVVYGTTSNGAFLGYEGVKVEGESSSVTQ
jgi:hypothetical protein